MVWPSLYEPACFVRQVAKLSEIVAHVMLCLHMCEDLTPESWSGCPWGTLDIDFGLHRAWSFWYYAFHVKYLKLIAKHLFICQEYVKCVFLYPDKSVMVISVLVKAVTWDTSLTVLQWNKKRFNSWSWVDLSHFLQMHAWLHMALGEELLSDLGIKQYLSRTAAQLVWISTALRESANIWRIKSSSRPGLASF